MIRSVIKANIVYTSKTIIEMYTIFGNSLSQQIIELTLGRYHLSKKNHISVFFYRLYDSDCTIIYLDIGGYLT